MKFWTWITENIPFMMQLDKWFKNRAIEKIKRTNKKR